MRFSAQNGIAPYLRFEPIMLRRLRWAELYGQPRIQMPMDNLETAVFGGGCFWCLEAVFDRVSGVVSVESGYMGGRRERPSYDQVCTGSTGHVEVVRIKFNPAEISYRDLLDIFFTVHDPITMNRQGNDVGTQYRSVIFYSSEEQRRRAEEAIAALNEAHTYKSPVVTAVEPATDFWMAEEYHQEYFENNSNKPYCRFVISPKLQKFQKKFAARMKGGQQKTDLSA